MLSVKIALAGLIIAFTTFLGYLAAGKYRARKSFFSQLVQLNEKFLAELKFSRQPLPDFLSRLSFRGDFQKTVDRFLQERNANVEYAYLTSGEKEFLQEYFSMLGRGDSASQSGFFSAKCEELNSKKQTAEKEAKEYGELFLKLGLIAGLAFVILIV